MPRGRAPTLTWPTCLRWARSMMSTAPPSSALTKTRRPSGENTAYAVFSPDGRRVFVSAEEGGAVDIIDLAQRKQVGQVSVGARPRGIGFSPDGKRAYVAAENA